MGPRASGQNSGVRRGRCNVTHDVVTPEDFFGTATRAECAGGLSVQDTVAWFASLGVELKREETGVIPGNR